jgi:hypothetical protein
MVSRDGGGTTDGGKRRNRRPVGATGGSGATGDGSAQTGGSQCGTAATARSTPAAVQRAERLLRRTSGPHHCACGNAGRRPHVSCVASYVHRTTSTQSAAYHRPTPTARCKKTAPVVPCHRRRVLRKRGRSHHARDRRSSSIFAQARLRRVSRPRLQRTTSALVVIAGHSAHPIFCSVVATCLHGVRVNAVPALSRGGCPAAIPRHAGNVAAIMDAGWNVHGLAGRFSIGRGL